MRKVEMLLGTRKSMEKHALSVVYGRFGSKNEEKSKIIPHMLAYVGFLL